MNISYCKVVVKSADAISADPHKSVQLRYWRGRDVNISLPNCPFRKNPGDLLTDSIFVWSANGGGLRDAVNTLTGFACLHLDSLSYELHCKPP